MALRRRIRKATPARAKLLELLVKEHGWRVGAELGVLEGRTILHLLQSCPELTMWGVDIWEHWPEKELERERGGRGYGDFDMEGLYRRLKEKAKPFGARANLLRMKTTHAAETFGDGMFDFVFIDADHTYEGVAADIEAWLPKIRKGGWMLGHDYHAGRFDGVIRAVNERFGEPRTYCDYVWGVTVA